MKEAFDLWIREKAPPVPEQPAADRHLRERIADRLHARRQRRVTRGAGLAAAAVMVAVLGFIDVTPLGGNNWNLIPSRSRPGAFEDPVTGQLYNKLGPPVIAGVNAKEFWERVREEQAAGVPSLDAIVFYELDDQIQWMLFYHHRIGNESSYASGSIDRPSTMPREVTRWLYGHIVTLDEDMANGDWMEAPGRRYPVNGHDFWFQVWVKTTERGKLYHGTAIIPDALK